MAPAKTPKAVIALLNREINDVFKQPEVQDTLLKMGAVASPSSPAEMRAFIESELARWTPVIKAVGITAQ
jgi:tripartite-type tricarboxylate transporter receptor subunit TctC